MASRTAVSTPPTILERLRSQGDVYLAGSLIGFMAIMVIPLPAPALDIQLSLSVSMSLLVLLVT